MNSVLICAARFMIEMEMRSTIQRRSAASVTILEDAHIPR